MNRREVLALLCSGLGGVVSGCNTPSDPTRGTFAIESARAYETAPDEVVSVVELRKDRRAKSTVALRWEVDTGTYRTATEQAFVIPEDVPEPTVAVVLSVSAGVDLSEAPSSRIKLLRDGAADSEWVDVAYSAA